MSALIRRDLPWWEPTALARALAARLGAEGLVLLDGDGGPLGQRAVLGVDPLETVCCRGLPGDPGATDPFEALRAMGEAGGPWLGWLAYEAAAWLEPSVPWRDPEMASLWAVHHDPLIHFDRADRRCWLEGRDPQRLEALAAVIAALPPPKPQPPVAGCTPAHSQALAPGETGAVSGAALTPAWAVPEPVASPSSAPLPAPRSGAGQVTGRARQVGPAQACASAEGAAGASAGAASIPPSALPDRSTAAFAAPSSGAGLAGIAVGDAAQPAAGPRLQDGTGAAAARPVPLAPSMTAMDPADVAYLSGPGSRPLAPAAAADAVSCPDAAAVPLGEDASGGAVPSLTPVAGTPGAAAAIPLEAWQWHTSSDTYAEQVGALLERIAAGDLFQANLTACCETWLEVPPDPLALWERLSSACPAPFAGVAIGSGGAAGDAVISASPERFLQLSPDGLVETRPIKGTRPRSAEAERDAAAAAELVCDPKDRAENVMIVDLLRNDLGRVCEPGSIAVPQLVGLESYARVHHLTSVVTGRLRRDQDLVDLLRACWPGGSISGAPKLRACTRLHGLEPVPRGPYCGSLFHWDAAGGFDSSILIRSVMASGRRLRVHAGGGIVADSDPACEAEEMGWKIGPLLEALA